MADYTFYTVPMSRGQIARWALHEAGADYQQVLVDWANRPPELAAANPNLIGYKDGFGDIELMVSIRRRMGDRFSYLGGLPTAEVYAAAYKAMGVPVYSSAVFNFIPRTAMDFYHAVAKDDHAAQNRLLDTFFLPYLEIRNKSAGYAVSIIKAGATIVGHGAGPVRAPLTDLKPAEVEQLAALIAKAGVK
jgi:5-dehydro-4-deoxyglucarate dehydratase